MNLDYWQKFYADKQSVSSESGFAAFVAERYADRVNLIDVGCGDGRDSYYFARNASFNVIGLDASEKAVEFCLRRKLEDESNITFKASAVETVDFQQLIAEAGYAPEGTVIYSRFFLHAIDEEAQSKFLESAAKIVSEGAVLCVEFRTEDDELLPKVEAPHDRRFVSPKDVKAHCASLGLALEFEVVGQGLAVYREEDPVIARLIFKSMKNA